MCIMSPFPATTTSVEREFERDRLSTVLEGGGQMIQICESSLFSRVFIFVCSTCFIRVLPPNFCRKYKFVFEMAQMIATMIEDRC